MISSTSSRTSVLPSGRSVVVRATGTGEELEVRSPDGKVEVQILLTESGPVVRLQGARLELESADAVAIRCRRFEVEAAEGVYLTGEEMRVETRGDIHLNGGVIRLNC